MKTLKFLVFASVLAVPIMASLISPKASAGLAPLVPETAPAPLADPTNPDTVPPAINDNGQCPASSLDVYFRAFESEVSAEATAVLMSLALAYATCDVERIEIRSLAVDSASPDSTRDIAAQRGQNLAGLMRVFFLGRTDVVVKVEHADDGFGPKARRARVRFVT